MIHDCRAFVVGIPRMQGKRFETLEHLRERGVYAEPFDGVDYQVTGVVTRFPYEVDNPGSGFNIGPKLVNLYLTQYMLWKVCSYLPNDSFMIFEDDVRLDADWREHFDQAVSAMPRNWDLLYVGSCCAQNDERRRHIRHRLFHVQYAVCNHAYIVRKKALPALLHGCHRVYAPIDIAMNSEVRMPLQRFAILPRVAQQLDTFIPP